MPVKQLMQCGATYFHATDKGDHPQQECFRIAKDLDHQFFVSCESSRGRMFASYESADDRYGHYLQFKGTRSFYLINRSIELGHVSKLYLDTLLTRVHHLESSLLSIVLKTYSIANNIVLKI